MIFIDIGVHSINLDHVTKIYRSPNAIPARVTLEFDVLDGDNAACLTLNGNEAIAFKHWWDCHRKILELTIVEL